MQTRLTLIASGLVLCASGLLIQQGFFPKFTNASIPLDYPKRMTHNELHTYYSTLEHRQELSAAELDVIDSLEPEDAGSPTP